MGTYHLCIELTPSGWNVRKRGNRGSEEEGGWEWEGRTASGWGVGAGSLPLRQRGPQRIRLSFDSCCRYRTLYGVR